MFAVAVSQRTLVSVQLYKPQPEKAAGGRGELWSAATSQGTCTGLRTTRGTGCWHPIMAVPQTSGKGPHRQSLLERAGAGCRGMGVCVTVTAWAAFLLTGGWLCSQWNPCCWAQRCDQLWVGWAGQSAPKRPPHFPTLDGQRRDHTH